MKKTVPGVSIAAVERETGLGKDLLRVWERRYGFPQPHRDMHGDRIYPPEQVEKLHLLRRLIDEGHRPGKIVGLPTAELDALRKKIATGSRAGNSVPDAELRHFIDILQAHQVDELRASLAAQAMRRGLERIIIDVAAPLCQIVGDAWAQGELQVFEEHLFTEELTRFLRVALQPMSHAMTSATLRPRVLLTTLPGEPHAIGLLMAEAMLALNGCACISLGPQTPPAEIVRAARAQQVDIVALSFSAWLNTGQVGEMLTEFTAQLDPAIEIWAGGESPALIRNSWDRIRVTRDLAQIGQEVEAWRQRQSRRDDDASTD